jgi:hypothetical protein
VRAGTTPPLPPFKMSDNEEVDGSLPDDDYDEAIAEGDFAEEEDEGPEISYETEDEEIPDVRFSVLPVLVQGSFV